MKKTLEQCQVFMVDSIRWLPGYFDLLRHLSIELKQMLTDHVLLLLFQICIWSLLSPDIGVKEKIMTQLKVHFSFLIMVGVYWILHVQ
jgi:hypothetical protein